MTKLYGIYKFFSQYTEIAYLVSKCLLSLKAKASRLTGVIEFARLFCWFQTAFK